MQEEVIAKVVEWIQAMGRGEKVEIESQAILHGLRQQGNYIKMYYEDLQFHSKFFSSLTLNDMLYFAQQQVEKEEKDA